MTGGRFPKGVRALLPALLLGSLVGCWDDGPRGPGALVVRVEAGEAELGSALVEVRGPGIQGFEPARGSRVFSRALEEERTYRAVIVNPSGGELLFRLRVDEVSAAFPSAVVLSAADASNQLVTSGTSVVFER